MGAIHSTSVSFLTAGMVCVACGRFDRTDGAALCDVCRGDVVTPPARSVGSPAVLVRAWAHHHGAPRQLVIRLKYQGLLRAAAVLADGMAGVVPFVPDVLVPVPRAMARRVAYGIDPASELAKALSARLGVPVSRALRSPLWWRAHAGRPRGRRPPPRFTLREDLPARVLLVDDVVTTGATLAAAAAAIMRSRHGQGGHVAGVTATCGGTMSSYAIRAPRRRA